MQRKTIDCLLLSNHSPWPFLQNSHQSLVAKLQAISNTNTKMYCMCPHTNKHTRREHEHATHPQDVRKWGLLPSLTLSRLGLKPGLFTAGSWPVSPSLPCILGIYSPITRLENSCSSQDDKQQSIGWILLWLCASNLFSHPVCSEGTTCYFS